MTKTISIDPVSRIEGHLAISVDVENGKISSGKCSGEMFRGFEQILKGRDPLDAQQITQRICGVCPISHGVTSILAQDQAYNIRPPANGRLLRNLILGANYIQSHIIHFYHLSALDFVDIAAITKYNGNDPVLNDLKAWVNTQLASSAVFPAAPFLPRYEGNYIKNTELNIIAVKHYLDALDLRRTMHEAAAIWCGKIPHSTALIPGGVTEKVTADKIAAYRSRINKALTFINNAYIPDVIEVARVFPEYFNIGKGCGNFLAYGVFPETDDHTVKLFPSGVIKGGEFQEFTPDKILEYTGHSYFSSGTGLHPYEGETTPEPEKSAGYSWLKAPRYDGLPMEVGPLSRVLITYRSNSIPALNKAVDGLLSLFNAKPAVLDSVLGRHAARAIECKFVAERCLQWLDMLKPGQPSFQDFNIPKEGKGAGLSEAPRGALGHWLEIADHRIKNYQCIVPTTWNCSPRDDKGIPGPVEQALVGTPVADAGNPLEAARVVRSFDPCIACAVH